MIKRSILFVFFIFIGMQVNESSAKDLLRSKIIKLMGKKRNLYFDNVIFYSDGGKSNNIRKTIKAIRHSYLKNRGYERIVLDFDSNVVPKIYSTFLDSENKLTLDLFNTDIGPKIDSFGNSYFVENLTFYPIKPESYISLEIEYKMKVEVEIFYLPKVGDRMARIVIDVKRKS